MLDDTVINVVGVDVDGLAVVTILVSAEVIMDEELAGCDVDAIIVVEMSSEAEKNNNICK